MLQVWKEDQVQKMKINTSRSRAKRGMRMADNTKNRPEQIFAATLLKMHLPLWCHVDLEVEVSLFDADNPDVRYVRTIDIVIRNMEKKFAIEMNGPPHDEMPQMRKDKRRKLILEWKGNDYNFIEFNYTKMSSLWKKAIGNITLDDAVMAYAEIRDTIGDLLPLGQCNRAQIETMLRKTQM